MAISEKIVLLPDKPGVYLFRNKEGEIIYVGKARSLKNRVRSYFYSSKENDPKINALTKQIDNLEYIVVNSEIEALILECNLIKEHRPRFNVELKDDKSYPFLKISIKDEYPQVIITRLKKEDGALYFGPYVDVGALRSTLSLLRSIFPLRTCNNQEFKNRSRPCLYFYIKRCPAPCTGEISREDYRRIIDKVINFLNGKGEEVIKNLEKEMLQKAEELRFEEAQELRDKIQLAQKVLEKQRIVNGIEFEADILVVAKGKKETCAQVYFIREGKLVGRSSFYLTSAADLDEAEILIEFLKRYYVNKKEEEIPSQILLPTEIGEEKKLLEQWLSSKKDKKVAINTAKRGKKKELVEMAYQNVLLAVKERDEMSSRREAAGEEALLELQNALNLETPPWRIECYDISHFQGRSTVGSMVVFENGLPKPAEYRRFKITTLQGPDDYLALQNIISRRFKHAVAEIEKWGVDAAQKGKFSNWPDLLLIDGGKGQLGAVLEVMKELGLESIPVYALAKKEEHLFSAAENEPIILPDDSSALHLLQHIRDEAHRFAISYHQNLRSKASISSVLDEIPGIGPKRKKLLLNKFGSVKLLAEASEEEIARLEGISPKLAKEIHDYLNQP